MRDGNSEEDASCGCCGGFREAPSRDPERGRLEFATGEFHDVREGGNECGVHDSGRLPDAGVVCGVQQGVSEHPMAEHVRTFRSREETGHVPDDVYVPE